MATNKLFSEKTILEVCAGIAVNLTSAWFGVILITPGFLGISRLDQYIFLLTPNIIFGIFGMLVSFWLVEKARRL